MTKYSKGSDFLHTTFSTKCVTSQTIKYHGTHNITCEILGTT